MPALRTEITEIVTGLGALGDDLDTVLTADAAPDELRNVDEATWARLRTAHLDGTHRAEMLAAWNNGRALLRASDGLRNRRPAIVEWKGGHRDPGDESVPADLRIDHVYLISCKYLSKVLHNAAPAAVFDRLLAGGPTRRSDENWFDVVAAAEHQRSVPGWYRLRGVIGAAAVLAVVAGAAGLVLADPVGRATNTWATLNRQAVDVPVAGVSVEPPGAVAGNNTPGAAIDGKVEELSLAWTPSGEAACGAAPGTGWIVLQLREPTRIQGLMIYPGLHGDNPRRDAEYLPTLVGVEFDGVACAARQLGTAADWATIEVDSGRPVSTIRIGIARAETKSTEPGPRVSLTEIRPFTYA